MTFVKFYFNDAFQTTSTVVPILETSDLGIWITDEIVNDRNTGTCSMI